MRQTPAAAIRVFPFSLIAAFFSVLICTGCNSLSYSKRDIQFTPSIENGKTNMVPTHSQEVTFRRGAFGTKTALKHLSIQSTTNGLPIVTLDGYQSDQVEALGIVAEKTAQGVAAAFVPSAAARPILTTPQPVVTPEAEAEPDPAPAPQRLPRPALRAIVPSEPAADSPAPARQPARPRAPKINTEVESDGLPNL